MGQTLQNPFETAEWIYTIRSSMELSRPVVVQHHSHLTGFPQGLQKPGKIKFSGKVMESHGT